MDNELVFLHPSYVAWPLGALDAGGGGPTELREFGTTMKAPEYLAINPMGKVPALQHGTIVVTETAAICACLAAAFPEAGLAPPPGDPQRGPCFGLRFGMIETRRVFATYADRLAARPAAVRARKTDDALGASLPTA